jgi:predicted glutamine amidotransferase
MCRWITVLSSDPMSLSDIVLAPSNSLIQLSKDASFHPGYTEQNNHVTNGDGFGVGWYHTNIPHHLIRSSLSMNSKNDGALSSKVITVRHSNVSFTISDDEEFDNENSIGASSPLSKKALLYRTSSVTSEKSSSSGLTSFQMYNASVFKDTQPAWNNSNLRELCWAVQSHCIMAHVRAASSFAGISQQNCHPFKAGRLLFCHNGRIDQFDKVRRRFHELLNDEAFLNVKGTTDSEIIFALICTYLSEDKYSNGISPYGQMEPYGHKRLSNVIKKVLRTIERILNDAGLYDDSNPNGFSTCNFSLTDGETMVVTRYCDRSPTIAPPSLYFAFGNAEKLYDELTNEDQVAQFCSDDDFTYVKSGSSVTVPSSNFSSSSSTSAASLVSTDDDDDDDNSLASEEDNYVVSSVASATSSGDDSGYDETQINVENFTSEPGTVYMDVDTTQGVSLVVASCPLTRTHTWNPMPRNSIMWYTRGSLPELRLLNQRDKRHRRSRVRSDSIVSSIKQSS